MQSHFQPKFQEKQHLQSNKYFSPIEWIRPFFAFFQYDIWISIFIMVIGNTLARKFGLISAVFIIRFQAVVKSICNIAVMFFPLAGRTTARAGNHTIAIIIPTITGLLIFMFYIIVYVTIRLKELLLKFFLLPQCEDELIYLPVFKK